MIHGLELELSGRITNNEMNHLVVTNGDRLGFCFAIEVPFVKNKLLSVEVRLEVNS